MPLNRDAPPTGREMSSHAKNVHDNKGLSREVLLSKILLTATDCYFEDFAARQTLLNSSFAV